jgi:hypothetical protein
VIAISASILLAGVVPCSAAEYKWPPASQVFHPAALPDPSDRDETDAVLRRTSVLINHLKTLPGCPGLAECEAKLDALKKQATQVDPAMPARSNLLVQACALRRKVALSNPLLNFDRILFIKRSFIPYGWADGNHMCDQFFGFNASPGGGLFILEKAFSDQPVMRDVLADSTCQDGRLKGCRIDSKGGFLSPELSYDGKTILFAWTEIAANMNERKRYKWPWNEHNTYKIFSVGVDGSGLTQLTDGPWNDFDPCFLPSGRIMFISERRGGHTRCSGRPVPTYTLHSMNADGTDIVRLSPHETHEWLPSVGNDGMVVYTRWDYVDRGFAQAHHPWITTPDGRDPRAIHGNYSTGRRPNMELNLRAVPGSLKYIATAAAHHGQAYGSIILLDPSVPDDNAMSQVKRLTPDTPFPESDVDFWWCPVDYATPYPLSENFFLCVYARDTKYGGGTNNNYGIYLVDAFGNKELIYRDPAVACYDPIPVRSRPVPPVIPHQTAVGKPLARGQNFTPVDPRTIPTTGTVGLINVRDSLYPLPPDIKITHLRIIQVLPKTTPFNDMPRIGYGIQKGARAVLGTVPVEEDGSAYFVMPSGKEVYFQALDADGAAVQSMRSGTYVQPGENLTCQGCHNVRYRSLAPGRSTARAMRRDPSPITPEAAGSRPFSYPLLVQPVLDRYCVGCHVKSRTEGKKAPDLGRDIVKGKGEGDRPYQWYASYESLKPYAFFWTHSAWDPVPGSTPGKVGARGSKLYAMLKAGHHDVKLSPEDFRRIILWLDSNSDFYGAYENTEGQLAAQVVQPSLE